MKDQYYDLLKHNVIGNGLNNIPELSYSYKIKILKYLLDKFSSNAINYALDKYVEFFVLENRVFIPSLQNTLIRFCNIYNSTNERE